jgi:hypothetical protein
MRQPNSSLSRTGNNHRGFCSLPGANDCNSKHTIWGATTTGGIKIVFLQTTGKIKIVFLQKVHSSPHLTSPHSHLTSRLTLHLATHSICLHLQFHVRDVKPQTPAQPPNEILDLSLEVVSGGDSKKIDDSNLLISDCLSDSMRKELIKKAPVSSAIIDVFSATTSKRYSGIAGLRALDDSTNPPRPGSVYSAKSKGLPDHSVGHVRAIQICNFKSM